MIEILWLVSGMLVLAGALLWRSYAQRTRARDVVEVCQVLFGVMQDIQLHRGLSGAVLDGRNGFRGERDATEGKLQRSLSSLADQYGARHPVFRDRRWVGVVQRWESLHHNWQGLDFQTNLQVHCDVILGVTGILSWIADTHGGVLGAERARVIARWPNLIEHLGMLRALGMHLLSSTDLADDRALVKTIAHQRLAALRHLGRAKNSGAERALVLRSERVLARVEWLIDGNASHYHPYTFYEEITGVVDDWYRQLTMQVDQGVPVRARAGRYRAVLPRPGTGPR